MMEVKLKRLNNITKSNLVVVTVDGTVTKWLTVPGKAADYGADAASGGHDNKGPKGPRDLVKDALKAAVDSGLDLSEFDQFDQYDVNGDGNKINRMV